MRHTHIYTHKYTYP